MAAKTYKLKINKSDGTYVETASFTIPDTAGTYSLTLTLSNGSTINAGNIVVGTEAKTYQLTLTLSDGSTINAGTFTTPAVAGWHTVWVGNTDFSKMFLTETIEQVAGYYGDASINFNEITIDKPTRIDCTIENSLGTIKTEIAFVIKDNLTNMLFETTNPTDDIKEYAISVSIVNQLLEFTFSAFSNVPRKLVTPSTLGYVKLTKVEQYY